MKNHIVIIILAALNAKQLGNGLRYHLVITNEKDFSAKSAFITEIIFSMILTRLSATLDHNCAGRVTVSLICGKQETNVLDILDIIPATKADIRLWLDAHYNEVENHVRNVVFASLIEKENAHGGKKN